MEYNGRKIGFKRTIGAVSDLAKIAPNGDLTRIGEIFSDKNLGVTVESGAQFLAILNKWYEKSLVFENKDYKPDPIPVDWFLMLDMEEFLDLFNEAMAQFEADDKPTIETVDPKGKKNE